MLSWIIFIIQLVSSFMMIGIVWLQQLIGYPLFLLVPRESFRDYHRVHLNRSQLFIGPLMLVEAVSAGLLLIWPIPQVSYYLYLINFLLVAAIWIETFLMLVPVHTRLNEVHSPEAISRLIRLNQIRAATWTMHGLILIAILY